MIYAPPEIGAARQSQLDHLDELFARLNTGSAPTPWLGRLRRQWRARSAASSVEIEGYSVPPGEALAITEGTQTPSDSDADRQALASYARAMDHVGAMTQDPGFAWEHRVLLDLHFDACSFQPDKSPGLYRTGPIQVTSPGGGPPAFTGPPGDDVRSLMTEVLDWLEHGDLNSHLVVRAAMAHLHVVSVHPFRDGNGRISRIAQSLVLARGGAFAPEFLSIEEYLGLHTAEYYAALQAVQGGTFNPGSDATPWIDFCIDAHTAQALARLAQISRAAVRWGVLEALVAERGWPDRLTIALEQSFFDGVTRASYIEEADVSAPTASQDLRRLLDAGLVRQSGGGRNTAYSAADAVRASVEAAASPTAPPA